MVLSWVDVDVEVTVMGEREQRPREWGDTCAGPEELGKSDSPGSLLLAPASTRWALIFLRRPLKLVAHALPHQQRKGGGACGHSQAAICTVDRPAAWQRPPLP